MFEAPPAAPVAEYELGQQADSLRVNFQDTSTGAPTTWSWDFGDGGTSNQRNPSHTYAVPGEYTVVLTAGNAGGSNQRARQVTVNAITPASWWLRRRRRIQPMACRRVGERRDEVAPTLSRARPPTTASPTASGRIVDALCWCVSRSALLNAAIERDVDMQLPRSRRQERSWWLVLRLRRRTTQRHQRIPTAACLQQQRHVSVGASVINNNVESSLGAAVVVPGLVQNPGSFIRFRADVSGASPTTIRVRAWADGKPEPAGWQFTASDSSAAVQSAGSLGLRLYLAGGVSNAPVTHVLRRLRGRRSASASSASAAGDVRGRPIRAQRQQRLGNSRHRWCIHLAGRERSLQRRGWHGSDHAPLSRGKPIRLARRHRRARC